MARVIAFLKDDDAPAEVKRMAYIMFRNESANGQSGICNNYCGFQADSGRWQADFDKLIEGVVVKTENGTGKQRLFLAFYSINGCLSMLLNRVQGRGLFVGGTTSKIWNRKIINSTDLARAYKKEWVIGDVKAEPNATELKNFLSMYKQASTLFL